MLMANGSRTLIPLLIRWIYQNLKGLFSSLIQGGKGMTESPGASEPVKKLDDDQFELNV
jgi:hypothetical protein